MHPDNWSARTTPGVVLGTLTLDIISLIIDCLKNARVSDLTYCRVDLTNSELERILLPLNPTKETAYTNRYNQTKSDINFVFVDYSTEWVQQNELLAQPDCFQ